MELDDTGGRLEAVLLTVEEAALVCRVGRRTAYEMCHREWRSFVLRVGRKRTGLRVSRSGLLDWIVREAGKVDPPVPGRGAASANGARRVA